MKFFHLSDLHLGKRVNEFSLLEDQRYILDQILDLVRQEEPQAVVIAGDVYDKSVPSAEAVQLLDDFLWQLSQLGTQVLVISGNHDSPERMAFGGRLMEASGIHLSPVYGGEVEQVTLEDEWGPVHFYLLPFVKPVQVRRFFPDREIQTITQAMEAALSPLDLDPAQRQVLVTHQFVTGADRTDSEELWVGGSQSVDGSIFAPFDYVALGHIHRPQNLMGGKLRYCGTPLKYSFSELTDQKSVTVVELGKKGTLSLSTLPLTPLREMRQLKGSFQELLRDPEHREGREDYLRIILTDQEDIPDGVRRLQRVYPNLMALEYDNLRTRTQNQLDTPQAVEKKSPLELFGELYQTQNNQPMSSQQEAFLEGLIREIWEEEV